jgi:hypothetical protein
MNKNRNELISELSSDLTVSSRAGQTVDMIIYWLVFNFIVAILLIYYTGPFREGSLQQTYNNPQFFLESMIGLLAIVLLGVTAFRSGIPSNISKLKRFSPALSLLLIWLGFYVVGIWLPALEPSMLGKRDVLCYVETILYGFPSLILGLYIISRLWPLHGAWTGLMIGLAAGATPALIMQFACMYVPVHIITHHLIPGLMLGVIGLFAGKYYLSR